MRIARSIVALLLGLLALQASAGDFVTNPASTLPANTRGTKSNIRALPGGADPTKYIEATDYNEHTTRINAANEALLDLRTHTSGVFNIKSYGAVGDCVADDTAAIEAAIAAAPVNVSFQTRADGGTKPLITSTIYFPTPALCYRITHRVDIPGNKGIRLEGESQSGPMIWLDSPTENYAIRVRSDGGQQRSTTVQYLWFHEGGIEIEGNVRTTNEYLNLRFTAVPEWGIKTLGMGVVNVHVADCNFSDGAGGISIGFEQSDLWTIERSNFGRNTGTDIYLATSGVMVKDCDFEWRDVTVAPASFNKPFVHIEKSPTIGAGMQLQFVNCRFGNEINPPRDNVVIGPIDSTATYSTSPVWFRDCIFRGAASGTPTATTANSAITLNASVIGLLVTGSSFWTYNHFVTEAAQVANITNSRGTHGNVWAHNTYMGSPLISAFTAGAQGWEIDDPIITRLWMPGRVGAAPLPLNRVSATEFTSWGKTAGLTIAKDAVGPDGVAGSAWTFTRTATGSQNVFHSASGTYPTGVATCSVWLKAGTVASVRPAILSGGLWRLGPDVPEAVAADWRRHSWTVYGLGPADAVQLYIYVDADALASGTMLAAFPSCSDGPEPHPYVPSTTAQHAARPFQSLVLGMAVVGYGTAAPASGRYEVGDIWLHSAPTATSPVGWRCTTAGSPGTWTAIAQAAAQADSAAADVATLKTDFNALLAKLRAVGLLAP